MLYVDGFYEEKQTIHGCISQSEFTVENMFYLSQLFLFRGVKTVMTVMRNT